MPGIYQTTVFTSEYIFYETFRKTKETFRGSYKRFNKNLITSQLHKNLHKIIQTYIHKNRTK